MAKPMIVCSGPPLLVPLWGVGSLPGRVEVGRILLISRPFGGKKKFGCEELAGFALGQKVGCGECWAAVHVTLGGGLLALWLVQAARRAARAAGARSCIRSVPRKREIKCGLGPRGRLFGGGGSEFACGVAEPGSHQDQMVPRGQADS